MTRLAGLLFLAVLPLTAASQSAVNETWRGSGTYSAQNRTFDVDASVDMGVRYSVLMGSALARQEARATVGRRLLLDGQLIDLASLPASVAEDVKVWAVDFAYDIYVGSRRMSTVQARMRAADELTPSGYDWDELFPGLGEEQAKNLFRNGFQVRNFRVTGLHIRGEHDVRNHFAEQERIAERERRQAEREQRERERDERRQAEREQQERDRAEREEAEQAERERAERERVESSGGGSSTGAAASQASASAPSLSASAQDRYDRAVAAGDRSTRAGQYSVAASHYQTAYQISPSSALASRIRSAEQSGRRAAEQAERERRAAERAERERLAAREKRMEDNADNIAASAANYVSNGLAVGVSMYGEEFGLMGGYVGDGASMLVAMGTNDPASMLAQDYSDSTVDVASIWISADIGVDLFKTRALMPYAGGVYYTSLNISGGGNSGEESFYAVSYGVHGHLWNILIYQAGVRTPVSGVTAKSTEPYGSIGIQISR